jgi:hypothetical protein
MKKILNSFAFIVVLASCETVVDLDYKSNQSRIIIEGNITDQPGPYLVKISKSVSLTESINYPLVDNAIVVIHDDRGNIDSLIPAGSGIYRTTHLKGVEGVTYNLTVKVDDQIFTARSTMPARVPFESVKVDQISFMGDIEYNLIPIYKDPVETGNNYRFELSINEKFVNQYLMLNDEIQNGAVNTMRLEIYDDDIVFKKGDVINLTMQCVDKNVSSFYKALALMSDSGPGGGVTPDNPPNNISNDALGIFSAHTVETKTVEIP